MAQKHQMSKVTDRMLDRREFLKNSYNSAEREQELTIIGTSQVADDLNLFYERLSSIKDYHRKNPNAPVDGFRYELDGFRDELDREGRLSSRKKHSRLIIYSQLLAHSSLVKKLTVNTLTCTYRMNNTSI